MSNKCNCQIPNTDLVGRCFKCGGFVEIPISKPMTSQERIKADAERFTKDEGYQKLYIAGATAEHDRAQLLVDALSDIASGKVLPQFIASMALEQWKSGKGKDEPAKPIEYMPIHPEDARKSNCPKQFPMHLLDEGRAFSNHSQSLKRLKERGGLSVREILAIVGNKPWSYYGSLPWDEALKMLNEINNPRPADKK